MHARKVLILKPVIYNVSLSPIKEFMHWSKSSSSKLRVNICSYALLNVIKTNFVN